MYNDLINIQNSSAAAPSTYVRRVAVGAPLCGVNTNGGGQNKSRDDPYAVFASLPTIYAPHHYSYCTIFAPSMQLPEGKKVYFASDFHLGIPDRANSIEREKRLCRWLDAIQHNAAAIYLVGDLFDTWFEYRNVVPKGFTRFLGKLASLADSGIPIDVFTGNHDLWMSDYFPTEMGIPVHFEPIVREYNGKQFFIGHGDGLGPGDHGYKLLKAVMSNTFSQWLYRRVHPDTGIGFAGWLSRLGPKHVEGKEERFLGEEEWLIQFSRATLVHTPIDYFVFGHRHMALEYPLSGGSKYINLGDWIKFDSYAEFDGTDLALKYYKEK